MTKKKKSSCNPAAAAATAKVVRAAAARAKAQIAIKAQRGDPPVPRANHQLPRSMATGKDGKVKAVILGFLPVADLPTPPLPPAPKITNAEVYARVFGGWYLVGKMPKHAMELGGDKTLDFMIMLGVDRRCPDLPIELGDVSVCGSEDVLGYRSRYLAAALGGKASCPVLLHELAQCCHGNQYAARAQA